MNSKSHLALAGFLALNHPVHHRRTQKTITYRVRPPDDPRGLPSVQTSALGASQPTARSSSRRPRSGSGCRRRRRPVAASRSGPYQVLLLVPHSRDPSHGTDAREPEARAPVLMSGGVKIPDLIQASDRQRPEAYPGDRCADCSHEVIGISRAESAIRTFALWSSSRAPWRALVLAAAQNCALLRAGGRMRL